MKMRPFSKSHQNFELGGFSIGYVIATSEPVDSQVSPFSPIRTTFELVDIYKKQVSPFGPTRTTFDLGGFSIGYVIATSEPASSQVSLFSPVRTIFSNGCNTTWRR